MVYYMRYLMNREVPIMPDPFLVSSKREKKRSEEFVVTSLRMERGLQEAYDKLSAQTDRSRNELMCMALRYALDNLVLTDEPED